MSAQDNGGPAFPVGNGWHQDTGGRTLEAAGMTLRDYFAAKAMAALITEPPFGEGTRAAVALWDDRDDGDCGPEQFAYVSYRMADAMLKARQA